MWLFSDEVKLPRSLSFPSSELSVVKEVPIMTQELIRTPLGIADTEEKEGSVVNWEYRISNLRRISNANPPNEDQTYSHLKRKIHRYEIYCRRENFVGIMNTEKVQNEDEWIVPTRNTHIVICLSRFCCRKTTVSMGGNVEEECKR